MTVLDDVATAVSEGAADLAALDGRFLLVALALQLANLACRSLVWRNAIAAAYPERRVPVVPVAAAYASGVALNAFAPARGGDAAKLLLVRATVPGTTLATVAGTIVAVLLLDALIASGLVCLLLGLGVLPALPAVPEVGVVPVAVTAGAVALAGAALALRPRFVRRAAARVVQGLAILRSPRRYALTIAPFQLAGWACRIGVAFAVLAAFDIRAGIAVAALLVVLNGLSAAVPLPGGAGVQQVLAAFALAGVAPVADAVSYSLGLQLGVTAVNTAVGLAALMVLVGTARPLVALRAGRSLARDRLDTLSRR
ncbi:MAG: flippase-like domain-containing protein [Thermoleophilia bacterium]|nr:flippase-like domain-containing protein [Thermoleophilia bacterium]